MEAIRLYHLANHFFNRVSRSKQLEPREKFIRAISKNLPDMAEFWVWDKPNCTMKNHHIGWLADIGVLLRNLIILWYYQAMCLSCWRKSISQPSWQRNAKTLWEPWAYTKIRRMAFRSLEPIVPQGLKTAIADLRHAWMQQRAEEPTWFANTPQPSSRNGGISSLLSVDKCVFKCDML